MTVLTLAQQCWDPALPLQALPMFSVPVTLCVICVKGLSTDMTMTFDLLSDLHAPILGGPGAV
jgi:hypothetical protein